MTRLTALLLLAAFTFARAALAADTYLDGQSGTEAVVPEGFYGTHMHEKDADLFLQSDRYNAGITVLARGLTKKEVEQLMRNWPLDKSGQRGDVTSTIAVFDDRIIGYAQLQGGRMAVFSARANAIAIGNFVGDQWTDAHVAVVDGVARSVRVQRMAEIRFDVPDGFVKLDNAWTNLVFVNKASGHFVVVEKDTTDVKKTIPEQVVDAINAGLLGDKVKATVSPDVQALQPGIAQVAVEFTSDGVAMNALVTRVALPGEPLWIVSAGRAGSLEDERAINDFVIEKLKKMSRIVVASR